MTDPRELLDRYAGKYCGEGRREDVSTKAFAGLRAVLDLHKPQPLRAFAARVGGQCSYCHLGQPSTIARVHDRERHEHPTPTDDDQYCDECIDGDDYEPASVDWPCPTVQAVTKALGGEQ